MKNTIAALILFISLFVFPGFAMAESVTPNTNSVYGISTYGNDYEIHNTGYQTTSMPVSNMAYKANAEAESDLYEYSQKETGITITGYNGSETDIAIPKTLGMQPVTAIGDSVFKNHTEIKSITVPNGVTTIGTDAFSGCTGLESIDLPDSVISIGSGAFHNCTNLPNIKLPNKLVNIGNCALSECSRLLEIVLPDSVTSIGEGAFGGCTLLGNVRLSRIVLIPNSAFIFCNSLQNITIPDSVTCIDDGAFSSCSSLTEITIPDSVISIGASAFYNCTSINHMNIGKGLKDLGPLNNTGVREFVVDVDNPNFNTVKGVLFNKSKTELVCYTGGKIGPYTIPEGVKGIRSCAFQGSGTLTSVTVPDRIEDIPEYAFADCPALTEVNLGRTVKCIRARAFSNCRKLSSIYYWGSFPKLYSQVFDSVSKTLKVYYNIANASSWSQYSDYNKFPFCNLTVDLKDGTPQQKSIAILDGDFNLPAIDDPKRDGFKFSGWYSDADLKIQWNFKTTTVDDDVTLFAKWTPVSYTVTFDAQNGTALTGITASDDSYIKNPGNPVRTGYQFQGWFKDRACTQSWNFTSDKVKNNVTLYAKWTPITFSVTFDTQDGMAVTAITAELGTRITNAGNPLRAGFVFGGWYKDKACTVPWNFSSDTVTGNVTLYAKWTVNSPGGLAAASQTYNTIKLTWNAVPGATGYEVSRDIVPNGMFTWKKKIALTNCTDTSLKTGVAYYYKIRAYTTVGTSITYSSYSYIVSAKPVLAKPEHVKASKASSKSIKVSWGSVSGASKYEVYRATSEKGKYSLVATTAATSYVNKKLERKKKYYYMVRACKTVNFQSVYSDYSAKTSIKL